MAGTGLGLVRRLSLRRSARSGPAGSPRTFACREPFRGRCPWRTGGGLGRGSAAFAGGGPAAGWPCRWALPSFGCRRSAARMTSPLSAASLAWSVAAAMRGTALGTLGRRVAMTLLKRPACLGPQLCAETKCLRWYKCLPAAGQNKNRWLWSFNHSHRSAVYAATSP